MLLSLFDEFDMKTTFSRFCVCLLCAIWLSSLFTLKLDFWACCYSAIKNKISELVQSSAESNVEWLFGPPFHKWL